MEANVRALSGACPYMHPKSLRDAPARAHERGSASPGLGVPGAKHDLPPGSSDRAVRPAQQGDKGCHAASHGQDCERMGCQGCVAQRLDRRQYIGAGGLAPQCPQCPDRRQAPNRSLSHDLLFRLSLLAQTTLSLPLSLSSLHERPWSVTLTRGQAGAPCRRHQCRGRQCSACGSRQRRLAQEGQALGRRGQAVLAGKDRQHGDRARHGPQRIVAGDQPAGWQARGEVVRGVGPSPRPHTPFTESLGPAPPLSLV